MANINESDNYEPGVYLLETTDRPIGGVAGLANRQAGQLANRTDFLKKRIIWTGTTPVTATANLTNAACNTVVTINSVTTSTILTLPLISTCKDGDKIRFENSSNGSRAINIYIHASDTQSLIDTATTTTFISLEPGASVTVGLVGGVSAWRVLARETRYVPPTGSLFAHSVIGTPLGYLRCDGSAISRTTYSGLYAAIGTTYGVGDGTTTFNIPNLVGAQINGVTVYYMIKY